MPAIEVTNLQKTFQTKRKAAGMGGSMRALFKPEYSSVEAVRKLTFQMEAGAVLSQKAYKLLKTRHSFSLSLRERALRNQLRAFNP